MLFRPEEWIFKKSLKNGNFSKGLVHGFCQKSNILSSLFFGQTKTEKTVF